MKVQLHIDEKFSEEKVIIEAPALSDAIQRLLKFAQQLDKTKLFEPKRGRDLPIRYY